MIAVTLIVGAGLVANALLRRHSAALRHWVLAVSLGCAAAAPALEQFVPTWNLRPDVVARIPRVEPEIITTSFPQSAAQRDAPAVRDSVPVRDRMRVVPTEKTLIVIWITGVAVCLFILFVGVARLAWLASRSRCLVQGPWAEQAAEIARQYGLRRPIRLLQSEHPTLLVTWGLLRPRIILPMGAGDWPENRIRIVLYHELAHIQRGDWAAHMMAELLRAAYWFNPVLWIARRRLSDDSEQACDNAVLHQHVAAPEYAAHLLDLARAASAYRRRGFPAFPAPAMVRPSSLERRVTAMLNATLDRTPTTRLTRLATSVALVLFAVVIVGLGASAQSPAAFSGTVVDPMNSLVPDVKVALTNTRTSAKYEISTDATGRFEFVALPMGDYTIEASLPGFRTFRSSLTMGAQSVERSLALQLGALAESITVSFDPSDTRSPAQQTGASERSAPRTAQACTATSTGGNIRPPRKLKHVAPIYPAHLGGKGIDGVVVLEGKIGTNGLMRDLKVLRAAHPDLGVAAMEAVWQWEFDATLLNCTPIEVLITATVNFTQSK
jgi:TonB family protein